MSVIQPVQWGVAHGALHSRVPPWGVWRGYRVQKRQGNRLIPSPFSRTAIASAVWQLGQMEAMSAR